MCRLLGVCIRRVCLAHISMTFEPTCVDVYGRARGFGTVGHACAMKCEKFEKEELENVSTFSNCTERKEQYDGLSRRPRTLFASLGAAALSHTHRSRRGLHDIEAAFMLYVLLRFRARILALPRSHHNFCHSDIVTMRLLAPLQRCMRMMVHNFL